MDNTISDNKFNLNDVKSYSFTKYGGKITLVFDNGVTTRRHFNNVTLPYSRVCSLSGKEIPQGITCLKIRIKKSGYGTYYLHQNSVQEALRGVFKKTEEEGSDIVRVLRSFLNDCVEAKRVMTEEDKSLRKALRDIKFKASKVGVKMARANQLLEVLK